MATEREPEEQGEGRQLVYRVVEDGNTLRKVPISVPQPVEPGIEEKASRMGVAVEITPQGGTIKPMAIAQPVPGTIPQVGAGESGEGEKPLSRRHVRRDQALQAAAVGAVIGGMVGGAVDVANVTGQPQPETQEPPIVVPTETVPTQYPEPTGPVTITQSSPASTPEVSPTVISTPDALKSKLAEMTPEQRVAVAQGQNLRVDEGTGQIFAEIVVAGEKVTARYDLKDATKFGVENGWVVQAAQATSGKSTLIIEFNPYDTSHSEKLVPFRTLKVVDQGAFNKMADMYEELISKKDPGHKATIGRFKISGQDIGDSKNHDPEFRVLMTSGDTIYRAVAVENIGNQRVVTTNLRNSGLEKPGVALFTGVASAIFYDLAPNEYFSDDRPAFWPKYINVNRNPFSTSN